MECMRTQRFADPVSFDDVLEAEEFARLVVHAIMSEAKQGGYQ